MSEIGFEFSVRFLINLLFVTALIYGSYFRRSRNHQLSASFVLFGVGIFVITYTLRGAEMSMGFAFGLFAVFTMLRYRTEPITIKEMTYLFLVIAVALLSAVSSVSFLELCLLNGVLCLTAVTMDSYWLQGRLVVKKITLEKIELIKPELRLQLWEDLTTRTGLDIRRIDVLDIDFLRDTARIKITYLPDPKLHEAFPSHLGSGNKTRTNLPKGEPLGAMGQK